MGESCYICFEGGPDLIRPCACKLFVHRLCLQKLVGHSRFSTVCPVCRAAYTKITLEPVYAAASLPHFIFGTSIFVSLILAASLGFCALEYAGGADDAIVGILVTSPMLVVSIGAIIFLRSNLRFRVQTGMKVAVSSCVALVEPNDSVIEYQVDPSSAGVP